MEDFVEVGKAYRDDVYVESAKRDKRNEHGGINTRALRKMPVLEASVTQYGSVQITTQRKTDLIEEEAQKVRAKGGDVQTIVKDEHEVDERREVSRTPANECRRDGNDILEHGVERNGAAQAKSQGAMRSFDDRHLTKTGRRRMDP